MSATNRPALRPRKRRASTIAPDPGLERDAITMIGEGDSLDTVQQSLNVPRGWIVEQMRRHIAGELK